MKKKYVILFTTLLGIIMVLSGLSCSKPTVSEGKTVKVHYTLTVDGQVVDSSNGSEPLQFKAGEHKIIPGFEKAVMGMKAGGGGAPTLAGLAPQGEAPQEAPEL